MSEQSSKRPSRSFAGDALETVTLWGLAVAQPIYDLLSRGAEFLLAHQLKPVDIVFLAVVLSFLLPGLLATLEWLGSAIWARAGRRGDRRYRLHPLSVTVLVAAIVLQALKELPAAGAVAAALALGTFCAWALNRWAAARSFVAILSPAAMIFPALFLFHPPVSGMLFGHEIVTGEPPAIQADTPIVFVVLDELPTSSLMAPDQRIDAGRYPAFAELAGRSHWFRNATSVAEGTTYAVPAILTGRYPDRRRVAHLSQYPENLFTWLGDAYAMNVFESLTRLCPEDLRRPTGLEEGFSRRMQATFADLGLVYLHRVLPSRLSSRLPPVTSTWRDFRGGPEPEASEPHKRRGASAQVFEQFIRSIRPTDEPVLHFLHVNLPHLPWKYLPSGKEYGPMDARQLPHGLRGEKWADDPWPTIQGFQRHLLQLAYTDRLLGRLIERLRAAGLYERALVVVTADHGASFWPGGSRREATAENRADILAVPLLVKAPFQTEGVISERNVETIDVLPTLADVLDSPLPWPVDGHSVLDGAQPERPHKVLIDAAGHEIVGRVVLEQRIDSTGATLERKHSVFGSAKDPRALFRIGRYRDLIGRNPGSLRAAPGSDLEVALSDTDILAHLDLASSYVPAHIAGSLGPSNDTSTLSLAVAVNGRIQAVTETYADLNGDLRFTAMVPEASFNAGFNPVEIFAISAAAPNGAAPSLAAIPTRATVRFELRLAADGSAEQITADGRPIRIAPGALQGEVVFDGVSFKGWAADVDNARIADSILLFIGSEMISRVGTGDFRRDLAELYKTPALARAGFNFIVPYSKIDDPSSPNIRFFALLDGVAVPLPYRDAWTPASEPSASRANPKGVPSNSPG